MVGEDNSAVQLSDAPVDAAVGGETMVSFAVCGSLRE